ncbi:MAG: YraN family protein [Clostridia bacterium]|nr:YraN family protein [Clostridia bacterium]
MNRRQFGNAGEDAACAYLVKKGWKILGRNVRRGPGEIDIIARKRDIVAFVEVKRRSSASFGRPAEAVNFEKQRRIAQAAALYMQENGLGEANIRFDVIEILPGELRHIEAAFDATDIF